MIIGAVAGTTGTLQAVEVIKVLLGVGKTLLGRLLLFNAWEQSFEEYPIRRDPACPVCGSGKACRRPE